ncbi:hypothetical protein [Aureispira anguillae]|uniref:Uncharacterized protein n=1 Tax=Aureispira anguillae TaxID=2864201 RepID=A0A915YG11_9BACT|nr:hypothetical protein [Aureispira anguillae]BDS12367.1 hypothetical protein AsAng_0030880 [Aureispira anguillae]
MASSSGSKPEFKLKKDSLTYLLIKTSNSSTPIKRYSLDYRTPNHPALGVDRLERVFIKGKAFEWAVLYDNKTNQIQAYYHPKTQDQQLSKDKFQMLLGKVKLKLYIIYTAAYKLKTGRTKGLSMPIQELTEIPQYWNQDVERIMVYENGKHTQNFIKGQFFKL